MQVQRVVMTAEYGGSCLSNLLPAEGGSGSFTLSLKDPFTGRTETTGALDFGASAAEVQFENGCRQFLRYLFGIVHDGAFPAIDAGISAPSILLSETAPVY